jgi:hypothetical protein
MSMMRVQALPLSHSAEERRALLEKEQESLHAERSQQMVAQRAESTAPEERIRLWERLHGLQLPREPDHKLLTLIAQQTKLSIAALHDEQQRRASRLS